MRKYEYDLYSFQDGPRAASSKERIDQRVADGYEVHTAMPNFNELAILWHKPEPPTPLEALAGQVHCPGCTCTQQPAEEPAPE